MPRSRNATLVSAALAVFFCGYAAKAAPPGDCVADARIRALPPDFLAGSVTSPSDSEFAPLLDAPHPSLSAFQTTLQEELNRRLENGTNQPQTALASELLFRLEKKTTSSQEELQLSLAIAEDLLRGATSSETTAMASAIWKSKDRLISRSEYVAEPGQETQARLALKGAINGTVARLLSTSVASSKDATTLAISVLTEVDGSNGMRLAASLHKTGETKAVNAAHSFRQRLKERDRAIFDRLVGQHG